MKYILSILLLSVALSLSAQERGGMTLMPAVDSVPNRIPDFLSPDIFIPRARLVGINPWTSAPLPRPVFKILPVRGFDGSVGFGEYSISHPDKFFSTLDGYNSIDIPQLYITRQMMIGNTFRLARNFYMLSGILYGAQMGVMGNNWGLGNREGFIWHHSAIVSITVWNQYFQSISVYSPIMYPSADGAAVKMPATPEVFSFGVQASFVVGEFIIGIGTSVTPKPPKSSEPKKSR
ncbi:MAG: hypothetical protein E7123_09030 [Bacteroidales bacterium]|nr:hypothetical protein [Bacteroidales bacterium]